MSVVDETKMGIARGRPTTAVIALQLTLMGFTWFSIHLAQIVANGDHIGLLVTLSRLTVLCLLMQISLLWFQFGNLLAPPVIYALLLSLFTSGWLLLKAFGIEKSGIDVVGRLPSYLVTDATAFYLQAFGFFCLGAILSGNRVPSEVSSAEDEELQSKYQVALNTVGWVCTLGGIVPFALININSLSVVATRGYSAYYEEGSRLSAPVTALSYFFMVGLVFLGCSGDRRRRLRVCVVLSMIGGLRLLSGDRGDGLIILLSVLLLWRAFGDPERRKSSTWRPVVLYGAIAILVTPLVGILRHSMSGEGVNLKAAMFDENPVIETIHTLGITMFPLVQTISLVPEQVAYIHGRSYLSGMLRLLPDSLLPYSAEELTTNTLYASPASWLMDYLGMSSGPGFTPFAEVYLNFGSIGGLFAMLVFGTLMGLALRLPSGSSRVRVAVVVTIFILCGFSVRGSSNYIIPYLFRFVLLPLLAVYFIAHGIKKARNSGKLVTGAT